jgi:uncharacterized protein
MPTLRDLVSAIRQRPGIDAAVVVGRDGLVIAGDASPHVDLDELAARVPPLMNALDGLVVGASSGVIEHERGHVIYVSLPGDDGCVLVLAHDAQELGALVTDLRRYRERIAELV